MLCRRMQSLCRDIPTVFTDINTGLIGVTNPALLHIHCTNQTGCCYFSVKGWGFSPMKPHLHWSFSKSRRYNIQPSFMLLLPDLSSFPWFPSSLLIHVGRRLKRQEDTNDSTLKRDRYPHQTGMCFLSRRVKGIFTLAYKNTTGIFDRPQDEVTVL